MGLADLPHHAGGQQGAGQENIEALRMLAHQDPDTVEQRTETVTGWVTGIGDRRGAGESSHRVDHVMT
jgi:hypothetical protein